MMDNEEEKKDNFSLDLKVSGREIHINQDQIDSAKGILEHLKGIWSKIQSLLKKKEGTN